MSVKIKDDNFVPDLLKEINKIIGKTIKVGIFGSQGADILMIATVNEFGISINVTDKMRGYLAYKGLHLKKSTTTINIPERSYIRGGYDAKKKKIFDFAEKQLENVYSLNINAEQYMERLAIYCVGQIQDYMTSLKKPPNHPFTIQEKGSSNPLINTGRLRESITYKIE